MISSVITGSLPKQAVVASSTIRSGARRTVLNAAAGSSHILHNIKSNNSYRSLVYPTASPFLLNNNTIRCITIHLGSTASLESVKFRIEDVDILGDNQGEKFFLSRRTATEEDLLRSPLIAELFELEHVKSVFLGKDFVTVTKYAEGNWGILEHEVKETLEYWVDLRKPALYEEDAIPSDEELIDLIKECIETRIQPAVQEDGGDISYVDFDLEEGVVTVELSGACVGCSSSSVTLKQGVEKMLKYYIPEVKEVISVENEEDAKKATKHHGGAKKISPFAQAPQVEVTKTQKKKPKLDSYAERLKAAGLQP